MLVLEEIYKSKKNLYPDKFNLRFQRSLSWFQKALQFDEDLDMKFMNLWISLNSLYLQNDELMSMNTTSLQDFLVRVYQNDRDNKLNDVLWGKYNLPIRLLLVNPNVYQSFWDYKNQKITQEEWRAFFETEKNNLQDALTQHDSVKLLGILFTCLFTMRNQLLSGGATPNSVLMRKQLRDACTVMSILMTNFMHVLLENIECIDVSKPFYPTVQVS